MDQYNPFAALSVILGSLLLTAVGAPAQAAGLPVIISTTVDYTHNTLTVNGQNFGSFLSTAESNAASTIDTQQASLTQSTSLLQQAQANRTQIQGVSLDTESVNLIQYQEAFQASSEVISVINQMMQDAENMLAVTT